MTMDDPDRPVTRAELARVIVLMRTYTQYGTLMAAAILAKDTAAVKEHLKILDEVTDELVERFGADIPRG